MDPWSLVEDDFSPQFLHLTEATFALSNGTIGVRGTLDEGRPSHVVGTYINAFYETWPIVHPETAYGFAQTGQTIVNVPDATVIQVLVDGEEFTCDTREGVSSRRILDFRTGVLTREVTWRTNSGINVQMRFRRLVSLVERSTIAFEVEVELDTEADVEFVSRLVNRQDLEQASEVTDPRQGSPLPHRVLEPGTTNSTDGRLTQGWVTANSRLGLLIGVDHRVEGVAATTELRGNMDDKAVHCRLRLPEAGRASLLKVATYQCFIEEDGIIDHGPANIALDRAIGLGMDGLVRLQEKELSEFWASADVELGGPSDIQQAVRWNLFQLHQASATLLGTSIPAKGLTGQAYDGHYFWDVEIYVLPFLIYTNPAKAAEILSYRYRMLGKARERAAELSHPGALFPWRTINGEESSAYFLAGTAQYHINADIIYALRKYNLATGDDQLLWDIGVEMAIETARVWADVGFYRHGRFHIHGVTGPDEYSALVHDNAYTNTMARMALRFAADAVDRMRSEQPERHDQLVARLRLDDEELSEWRRAAELMYVPFDEELGITPQDEGFLANEPWDFASVPPSKYPLLLHFHPLVIYRHQVLKQTDVVLADFLLGDEFDLELKRANFEYYDPITTGDSSLSASVEAIMAAELGHPETARRRFEHALFMDLADLKGNTSDGVHMASIGGVWMALVHGFGGFRDHRGVPSFDPRLPAEWTQLAFRLRVRGSSIQATVRPDGITFEVAGDPIEVTVRGELLALNPGEPTTVPL